MNVYAEDADDLQAMASLEPVDDAELERMHGEMAEMEASERAAIAERDAAANAAREYSRGQCVRGAMPLSPALLVAALNPFLGMGDEVRVASHSESRGAFVGMLLAAVHEPPQGDAKRWDVALVSYVGYWSHYDQRICKSSWPLPATGDVDELVQFAAVSGATRERPLAGDIYCMRSPENGSFVRCGVVIEVERVDRMQTGEERFACSTIEGDCTADETSPGAKVLRNERLLIPAMGDVFIRWTALDEREERSVFIDQALDEASRRVAA
jgi:hypothetical protein